MGSGKSTIGQFLARRIDFDYQDMDDLIESEYRMTIADIFERHGEGDFRKIESEMLRKVAKNVNRPTIISVGGGTPCFFKNMEFMNENGMTIYLKVDSETLCERLLREKAHRPLVSSKEGNELKEYVISILDNRKIYYEQANHTVLANYSVSSIAKKLEQLIIN